MNEAKGLFAHTRQRHYRISSQFGLTSVIVYSILSLRKRRFAQTNNRTTFPLEKNVR